MANANDIAESLSQSLSEYGAEVCYAPDFELKKMQRMRLCVCPIGRKRRIVSRASFEDLYSIEVALVHKCREEGLEKRLIALSEEIGDRILKSSVDGFVCTQITWEPLYSVESLRDKGVFISVIGLLFKKIS